MADLFVDERLTSGDFDRGPGGGNGKILFYVLFAESPDEALAACEVDDRAPEELNGYLRGKGAVSHQGGVLYFVDFDYTRGIPGKADPAAGQPPEGGRPPDPEGDKDKNDPLPRDLSFSTGGATKRIYFSVATKYRVSKDGEQAAPDFGGLIGADLAAGKIEGTDILAPTADFVITKRFQQLTIGWFRNMLDLIATTNKAPYLGLSKGEVLFKGTDGQFKDSEKEKAPWTVTGRFGYSRNRVFGDHPPEQKDPLLVGALQIPKVCGWEYVWTIYEAQDETVTIDGVETKVIVQYPKFAYVEQVYNEGDFTTLGLN